MILNFEKQVAEITKILCDTVASGSPGLQVAMVLAEVYSKGMAFERERVLAIIARKALNASDLRAEINRPVR